MRKTSNQRAPDSGDTLRAFLCAIAAEVTGMRNRRGLSRRNLARQSGVSERYLAQIETGAANMSLEKLWCIAEALGTDVQNLLPGRAAPLPDVRLQSVLASLSATQQQQALELLCRHFQIAPSCTRKTGLAIIGMRGAGKTTLGRLLASRLDVEFKRMSQLIEELAAMPASEIFSLGGQQTWRRLEREVLEGLVSDEHNLVLETSGSLVSEPETYRLLRQSFNTVWLRCDASVHMDRVCAQGDARAFDGHNADAAMDDLRSIMDEREPLYRLADHVLDNSCGDEQRCLQQLYELGRRYLVASHERAHSN